MKLKIYKRRGCFKFSAVLSNFHKCEDVRRRLALANDGNPGKSGLPFFAKVLV
jgi:hypothetical protein